MRRYVLWRFFNAGPCTLYIPPKNLLNGIAGANSERSDSWYTPDRCRWVCYRVHFYGTLPRYKENGFIFVSQIPHIFVWWRLLASMVTGIVRTVHLQCANIMTVCCHALWANTLVAVARVTHRIMVRRPCILSMRIVSRTACIVRVRVLIPCQVILGECVLLRKLRL